MISSQSPNGPFPTNVSAYFRRPSKVVKTSSRNNSPRTTGRRRMTTNSNYPARTRSVVDYQRASMPQLSQYQPISNRPLSWHPNTMDEMNYLQLMHQHAMESNLTSPYTTIEMNGLVTPMSFPVMDEPQIQELISPLEDLSADDPTSTYGNGQDFSMETWLNQQQMKNQPSFGANMYPDVAYPACYQFDQYGMPMTDSMVHPSPDYMLMPQLEASNTDDVTEPEVAKDDLVGMGLYDSPADVQTSSLLFGNAFGPITRKSLKLEDAFEPAPASDEDDDDEAEDEDEDAPNEPDDMPLVAPHAASSNISIKEDLASSVASYPTHSQMDFLQLQHWAMSQNGNHAWI